MIVLYCLGNNDMIKCVDVKTEYIFFLIFSILSWLNPQIQPKDTEHIPPHFLKPCYLILQLVGSQLFKQLCSN